MNPMIIESYAVRKDAEGLYINVDRQKVRMIKDGKMRQFSVVSGEYAGYSGSLQPDESDVPAPKVEEVKVAAPEPVVAPEPTPAPVEVVEPTTEAVEPTADAVSEPAPTADAVDPEAPKEELKDEEKTFRTRGRR